MQRATRPQGEIIGAIPIVCDKIFMENGTMELSYLWRAFLIIAPPSQH